ncbi:class I SAM-dependent methyltransferase [Patescibacteria group bacterium]|nr:class I SAM-dependent methyltransferase [Patescibacteria group bacterium]
MLSKYRHRTACGICGGSGLSLILDLGKMSLANAFLKKEDLNKLEDKFPLKVYFCRFCSSLQLLDIVNPELLFRHYNYLTSASRPLAEHFIKMGKDLADKFVASPNDLVVEIGGNDGVLLAGIKDRSRVLNIEPAENIAEISRKSGVETIPDFFNLKLAEEIVRKYGNAKVVVANNVMAHVENLREAFSGVKKLINSDGVFVFEVHWVGNLIGEGGFDQIYHEHVFYHSLTALKYLVEGLGLKIFDVKLVPIHGQSMRVYVAEGKEVKKSVATLLQREKKMKLNRKETFVKFAKRVSKNKEKLLSLLKDLKKNGKRITGYGAPAKGNTLLNYLGIGTDTLDFLTDTTIFKQGLYSPGMHVPVVGPERLLTDIPDYILLLAWNYTDLILEKERELRNKGVKFIIPVPEVKIV